MTDERLHMSNAADSCNSRCWNLYALLTRRLNSQRQILELCSLPDCRYACEPPDLAPTALLSIVDRLNDVISVSVPENVTVCDHVVCQLIFGTCVCTEPEGCKLPDVSADPTAFTSREECDQAVKGNQLPPAAPPTQPGQSVPETPTA